MATPLIVSKAALKTTLRMHSSHVYVVCNNEDKGVRDIIQDLRNHLDTPPAPNRLQNKNQNQPLNISIVKGLMEFRKLYRKRAGKHLFVILSSCWRDQYDLGLTDDERKSSVHYVFSDRVIGCLLHDESTEEHLISSFPVKSLALSCQKFYIATTDAELKDYKDVIEAYNGIVTDLETAQILLLGKSVGFDSMRIAARKAIIDRMTTNIPVKNAVWISELKKADMSGRKEEDLKEFYTQFDAPIFTNLYFHVGTATTPEDIASTIQESGGSVQDLPFGMCIILLDGQYPDYQLKKPEIAFDIRENKYICLRSTYINESILKGHLLPFEDYKQVPPAIPKLDKVKDLKGYLLYISLEGESSEKINMVNSLIRKAGGTKCETGDEADIIIMPTIVKKLTSKMYTLQCLSDFHENVKDFKILYYHIPQEVVQNTMENYKIVQILATDREKGYIVDILRMLGGIVELGDANILLNAPAVEGKRDIVVFGITHDKIQLQTFYESKKLHILHISYILTNHCKRALSQLGNEFDIFSDRKRFYRDYPNESIYLTSSQTSSSSTNPDTSGSSSSTQSQNLLSEQQEYGKTPEEACSVTQPGNPGIRKRKRSHQELMCISMQRDKRVRVTQNVNASEVADSSQKHNSKNPTLPLLPFHCAEENALTDISWTYVMDKMMVEITDKLLIERFFPEPFSINTIQPVKYDERLLVRGFMNLVPVNMKCMDNVHVDDSFERGLLKIGRGFFMDFRSCYITGYNNGLIIHAVYKIDTAGAQEYARNIIGKLATTIDSGLGLRCIAVEDSRTGKVPTHLIVASDINDESHLIDIAEAHVEDSQETHSFVVIRISSTLVVQLFSRELIKCDFLPYAVLFQCKILHETGKGCFCTNRKLIDSLCGLRTTICHVAAAEGLLRATPIHCEYTDDGRSFMIHVPAINYSTSATADTLPEQLAEGIRKYNLQVGRQSKTPYVACSDCLKSIESQHVVKHISVLNIDSVTPENLCYKCKKKNGSRLVYND